LAPSLRAMGIAVDQSKAVDYMRTRLIHLKTIPLST
jgi:hypothetical protein